MNLDQTMQAALAQHRAGQRPQAAVLCRQVLSAHPDHPVALNTLAIIEWELGRHDAADELLTRLIALHPREAQYHNNLGLIRAAQGRPDDAIAAYEQAIALNPNRPEILNNLAVALSAKALHDDAIAACQKALALRPEFAEAHATLANALLQKNRTADAIAAYRQAIAIRPAYPQAQSNLGAALLEAGQLDEAIAACRAAIALNPALPEAHNNLANALRLVGQIDAALESFDRAIALRPGNAAFGSNRLFAILYHPDIDAAAILKESQLWDRAHAEPLRRNLVAHDNDPDPDRRLRIGYVGSEFRDHCMTLFTVPLFSNHDRERFDTFAYASVSRPDGLTRRLRGTVGVWRDAVGQSDEQLARIIRADRIDILVDLSMQMAQGRPLLFARKPAPIQVAYFGYPGTTGLATIDYRLTDPYLDPPGQHDDRYSEKSIRLPDTFWCYDPLTDDIDPNPLPAARTGHITFGCLNSFCKVTNQSLALWAAVLAAMPSSRMLLLAPPGSARERVLTHIADLGLSADRVQFVDRQPREEYLQTYHRIDIGLDTLPYNGHTTSLDSFWMGVPVVTLIGSTVVGRAGFSQLSNLRLTELVAKTPAQFIQIAAALAADLPRLTALRASLRQRMRQSPLMDAPRIARNVESAYRQMWRTWCQAQVAQ